MITAPQRGPTLSHHHLAWRGRKVWIRHHCLLCTEDRKRSKFTSAAARHQVEAEVSTLFGPYIGGRRTTRRQTVAAPAQLYLYTLSFYCIEDKNAALVPNRDRLLDAGGDGTFSIALLNGTRMYFSPNTNKRFAKACLG